MRALLIGFALLTIGTTSLLAEPACQLEEPQCQELTAYREFVPQIVSELNELKRNSASEATTRAYDDYLRKFYAQATELREIKVGLYRWQRSTATWIFLAVLILTLMGVALAAYQLCSAIMLGRTIENAKVEIGKTKMVITTSSVGILVLLLSFAFFIVFAKAIFPISN